MVSPLARGVNWNRNGGPGTAVWTGVVDLIGIEPTTSALRTRRSPS